MNFVIYDDDLGFAEQLSRQVSGCCQRKNWDCQCSIPDTLDHLLTADLSGTDALFLDIEIPGLNGLEAARRIRGSYPDLIIVFVTSYIQYAPAGYEVRAFRYLLKKDLDLRLPRCLADIQAVVDSFRRVIQIRTPDGEHIIPLRTIVYAEGTAKRHVVLHLCAGGREGSCLEYVGLLGDLENQLQDSGFLRIQRSYLVNMSHLEKINGYYAFLSTGEKLKVSVQNYRTICQQFLLWKGLHL